jgi:hypothetical protein
MKTSQQSIYCSRCGDELSADEMLMLDGATCAFCDHIRAEALQIHEYRLRNGKPSATQNVNIVGKTSGSSVVQKVSSRLPTLSRPTLKPGGLAGKNAGQLYLK